MISRGHSDGPVDNTIAEISTPERQHARQIFSVKFTSPKIYLRRIYTTMRQPPALAPESLIACLRTYYDLDVISVRFLPIGYDPYAFVYEAMTAEATSYFVKIRKGAINPSSLLVPRVLIEQGIPNILAPLRTRTQALWCALEAYTVVVFPFIRGDNAMNLGLSDSQWREFGATLGAIHAGDFAERLQGQVPTETFSLPSAALVRRLSSQIPHARFDSPAATRLAAFWKENAARIENILARAETLGRKLQSQPFQNVLCHADIHAANILVSTEDRIYLVDWDGPLLAPRERDLLFIVGSTIARTVEPHEEALFFQGYGDPIDVNMSALTYYRYERAIEDIGEFGKSVFLNTEQSETEKEDEVRLLTQLFDPGQIIESAMQADPNHA